jgi:predicted metal-binding membrane protein
MLASGTASASFIRVQRSRKGSQRKNRPVLAGLLVAFVLLLNALAAAPVLHEHLHCEADQPAHTCAVTLFAQGMVDVPVLDVPVVVALSPLPSSPVPVSALLSSQAVMLPPGRAPPVSISNS